MKNLILLLAVCNLLGMAFAQSQPAPAPPEAGTAVFFEAPAPPEGLVFTLPAEAPAAAFPADVVMMAGTPGAPAPPVFAWQGEAGERIFLRHAHGGPELGKWWKDSKIVTELKLTPAQITQIEQSFYDHRLKLIDLRADLEREETKLQPLVEADQPDEGKVSAQVDLVLAARGRLEKAHIMMMLAMRRSLSVEQWKKLESIKHERQGGWAGSMIAPRARGFHLAHPPQPAQPAQPAPAATPKPGDRM